LKLTVLLGKATNNGGSAKAIAKNKYTIDPSCLVHHAFTCEIEVDGVSEPFSCDSYINLVTDFNDQEQCTVDILLKHELKNVGVGCIALTSIMRDIDVNGAASLDLLEQIPSDERELCQGDESKSMSEKLLSMNICEFKSSLEVSLVVNDNECSGTDSIDIGSFRSGLPCEEISFQVDVTCVGTNYDGNLVDCNDIVINKDVNCNNLFTYTYTITNVYEKPDGNLFDFPVFLVRAEQTITGSQKSIIDLDGTILRKRGDSVEYEHKESTDVCMCK